MGNFGFDEAEDHGGKVTVKKEQSKVMQQIGVQLQNAGQEDPYVKGGLCMGYSATWIVKSAKGDDFWKHVDSADARTDLRMMARREHNVDTLLKQGMFEKMPEQLKTKILTDQDKWSQEYIIRCADGAVSKPERYEGKKFDVGDLCSHLTKGDGYKLLCMRGTTMGSHAVGVSVSKGQVIYMDPNAGEVKFEKAEDFEPWFKTRHVPAYSDAKFTKFYIDSYGTPINAVETVKAFTESESFVDSVPSGTHQPGRKAKRQAVALDPAEVKAAMESASSSGQKSKRQAVVLDPAEVSAAMESGSSSGRKANRQAVVLDPGTVKAAMESESGSS